MTIITLGVVFRLTIIEFGLASRNSMGRWAPQNRHQPIIGWCRFIVQRRIFYRGVASVERGNEFFPELALIDLARGYTRQRF